MASPARNLRCRTVHRRCANHVPLFPARLFSLMATDTARRIRAKQLVLSPAACIPGNQTRRSSLLVAQKRRCPRARHENICPSRLQPSPIPQLWWPGWNHCALVIGPRLGSCSCQCQHIQANPRAKQVQQATRATRVGKRRGRERNIDRDGTDEGHVLRISIIACRGSTMKIQGQAQRGCRSLTANDRDQMPPFFEAEGVSPGWESRRRRIYV